VETVKEIEKLIDNNTEDLLNKIERLENHVENMKEAFKENNKIVYDDGFSQGQSYQAIVEIRGRELFLDDLDVILCKVCKKKIPEMRK